MKLQTFYKLFYKHRVSKARIILKLYLLIIIPFRYLLNFVFFKKKINLDNYEKNNINLNNNPEFSEWKWAEEEFIKKNVTEFRKDIYQEVFQIFSKIIKDYT